MSLHHLSIRQMARLCALSPRSLRRALHGSASPTLYTKLDQRLKYILKYEKLRINRLYEAIANNQQKSIVHTRKSKCPAKALK